MTTRVVSAAIVREDEDPGSLLKRKTKRILLAQRLPPSSYPWTWCTPGGKVEPGESDEDALMRELWEEITWPSPDEAHHHNTDLLYAYSGENLRVACFKLKYDHRRVHSRDYPIPDPTEHVGGIGWFTGNELKHLAFIGMLAPADQANVDALYAILGAA